ncbi:MAG: hypothetical protein HY267_08520 [Deltaproteobacteria bacterium]|nr:hypothetical protein [Deltaproteobacteria bacterium]
MIVVSDTNILSSLAAGDALPALLHVFRRSTFCIPPSEQKSLLHIVEAGHSSHHQLQEGGQ